MNNKNKKKNILTVAFICTILVLSTTQATAWGDITRTIYGTVTDEHDDPIQSAKVELWKDGVRKKSDYTDSNGNYSITYTGPQVAIYYLKAKKSGYVTETEYIGWRPGNLRVDFQLEATFPMKVIYKGYVYDEDTFDPVEGATVKLYKRFDINDPWVYTEQTDISRSDGFYILNEDETEGYEGYPKYKIEVTGECDKEWRFDQPSCSGTYTENFYVTHPGYVQKFVLIIGIAHYDYFPWTPECFHAHNDALNWFEFFMNNPEYDADRDGVDDDEDGYIDEDLILILADNYYWPGSMPEYTRDYWFGPATENNIKWALNFFAQNTDENDFISIIFAGHAYSDDPETGSVYFATEEYDYEDPDEGRFYDTEYATKVEAFKPYSIFTFFDTPYSLGFTDEIQLLSNSQYTFTSVACRNTGINYRDDNTPGVINNGVWTYAFLMTLNSNPTWNIEEIQIYAVEFWFLALQLLGLSDPPIRNTPTHWDGNTEKDFYLY